MRLQTFSTRDSAFLSHVRLSRGPRRPLNNSVRYFYLVSKTGGSTVLMDRRQKPQTNKSRSCDSKIADKGTHGHLQVKRQWHLSDVPGSAGSTRFTSTKPYAASAANSGTSRGTRPSIKLAPNPVPNRAFPFIKHMDEQAALGLHKPIGLILASAYVLGAACQLSGVLSLHRYTAVSQHSYTLTAESIFYTSHAEAPSIL